MLPNHLGVIPDGNRRYARKAGVSYREGYRAAARRALDVAQWCIDLGIPHLSAFGVSHENLACRSPDEIGCIQDALVEFLCGTADLPVSVHLFGDVDALAEGTPRRRELLEFQHGARVTELSRLTIHIGVNYSVETELRSIARAAAEFCPDRLIRSPQDFSLAAGVPLVDLVVRTGGQQRLSGFLPLHTTYAELYFIDTFWPDLEHHQFLDALRWYRRQERRFGE